MKTILEIIQLSTTLFTNKHIQNARREAELLIADALALNRMDLYLQYDRPLTESELDKCREYIKRRLKKEPSQYIHGSVDFYDCKLKVNKHVLIPRQETEILVDKIAKFLGTLPDINNKNFWDICCGSGCIGIAIKKKFPQLNVTLSDISKEALSVAKENALLNDVNVNFLLGDLLSPFENQKADFLVSNPPYIKNAEFDTLQEEVRNYEPKQALISGETGFECYEMFAKILYNFLNPGAKCWFELGTGQGDTLIDLFKKSQFATMLVEKDWSGHDRYFFLEKD